MTTLTPATGPALRVKAAAVVVSPPVRQSSRRRSPRAVVAVFLATLLALNFGFAVGMDRVFPTVRDPEYGRRLSRVKARQDENPGRPFVVMLGSSRTAMGLRPMVANADAGPVVFNFAQVGSGPMMQVMTLRRMLNDGVKPDAVVLEFWPPFLREDGPFAEEARIDKHRLLPQDVPFAREYYDDAPLAEATMKHVRKSPWYEHRLRVVSQVVPGWLTYDRRLDSPWHKLDDWGWLPGFEDDPPPAERTARHQAAGQYYGELFNHFRIHEKAERATREMLTTCRERGIPVTFAWLPESSEFRAWYPPDVLATGEEFLAKMCREFDVPWIDARQWVTDPHIADGFHLTQPGAAIFSQRFGEELRARTITTR
ncbi:DUF1574 family protein [Limnoglobus roseus]|uniref:Uncharacterized protein n=1 Tax=Limnoglobus roseus TaxID=2598579 RepID=A0A5C1A641_9BACT|nr:DUF1574 family protein [Limnoglobus roseus]QEL13302.1 hypothetical protein PX52LOC_00156 [Limnoglobus roseus]